MNAGSVDLQVDIEMLKLLGAIFALFVSTVTVEFTIAAFVNSKRDSFPNRRLGRLSTVGEFYDWLWGYVLGLFVNIVFFLVASYVHSVTRQTAYSVMGAWVYWTYFLNVVLWGGGFILDGIRLLHPGAKRTTTGAIG
jgi:hypothetical protein